MLLSVGPLALLLIWARPKLSVKWKVGITIIVLRFTWGLWLLTEYAIKSLKDSLELYQNMGI